MLGPGDIIADRFRIERQLGEGGMGAVYLATQLGLKREVALKVILPQKTSDKTRERFLREARVASVLKHPNVVGIYDYGDHQGMLYLAMELLNGPSLRAIVDYDLPPLPVERAVDIAAQVADVLAAASAIPLVHRDLKPENVVLDRAVDGRERAVVVDFGLAFVAIDADLETGRLTREGAVTGTPDYMPPEQCRGALDVDGSADVYSLGAMLYEMLTARPPFSGSAAIVISRHLFVKPKRIRDAFPEIELPGALEDLVMSMLAKSPADRPSAARVRDALSGVRVETPERLSGRATGGRSARMVSEHPGAPAVRPPAPRRVAFLGTLDLALETALAANGIEAIEARDGIPSDVSAVFAPGAPDETIEALVVTGIPVVVDAPAGNVDRLTELLRLGVSEVCPDDASGADLARKLSRAIRRSERKR